ncbi:MAG: tetratricopeptide repeat protein [Fusobacterium sp.]
MVRKATGNKQIKIKQIFWEEPYNSGVTKASLGKYEEAIEDYNKAIEYYNKVIKSGVKFKLLPEVSVVYNDRGVVKANLEKYEEAIEDYNKAIELNPELKITYNNRGLAKAGLGKYEEAIEDYDEAIKLDFKYKLFPEVSVIYNNRGLAKADLEKYEEAIEDYNKAVELKPDFTLPYNNRGTAKANLGKYEEAIEDYDEAIKLKHSFTLAYSNRGLAKVRLSNYEGAIEDYEKAEKGYEELIKYNNGSEKKIKEQWMCYFNLGILYKESEAFQKSIDVLIKAIKLNEKSKENLLILGKSLLNFFQSREGRKQTIYYLEELKNKRKIEDRNEPIEKFIKYKCYFLINNLEGIDFLDKTIKDYLKLKISEEFREEFKIKVDRFKVKETKYKDNYYMYKSINNNLLVSLNERKLRKGNPYLFNDPFDPYYKEPSNKKSFELIKDDLKKIRISCFSENKDSLLMWAHYGEQHKGVCIEYINLRERIEKDKFTCFEKVIYEKIKTHKETEEKNGLLIDKIKIDEELLTINEMCLRKHEDWKYEDEWRIINLEKENTNELYFDNMEISKIFFGMKCDVSNIRLITKLLKDRDKIIFCKMIQGDNLTLEGREIELKNGEIILDENGEIKLRPKNTGGKQL